MSTSQLSAGASEGPDKSLPALAIHVLTENFWTYQYPPSTAVPPALWNSPDHSFITVSKVPDELTITLSHQPSSSTLGQAPRIPGMGEPKEVHGPWKALRVKGPMDLSLKGILHALIGPLKDGNVPIFALSTWNTDYVLVNASDIDIAIRALRADGWAVTRAGHPSK